MRDTLRRYRAIREALAPCSPGAAQGHVARPLRTFAAPISGMVASTSTQLSKSATTVPDGTKAESRGTRWARWLRNDRITEAIYLLPSAEVLLAHRALQTLGLVMDGRGVGRGCVALMMHVIYQGRALPVAGRVRHGKQGHCPEARQLAWVEPLQGRRPEAAAVGGLGEGACDGIGLQHTGQEAGWSSVCRPGINMTAAWDGKTLRLDTLGACSKPGTLVDFPDVLFTGDASGPIRLICCWAPGYPAPRYVVTTMAAAEAACRVDAQRVRLATFFADQKSRGFQLHPSPLSDPQRLSRLLMAAC